jgi:two-component system, NarL family, sensor histidine kinase DegS
VQAQEAERQRLAEEVHDGPAQVLTNAIFEVEYLDRMLTGSSKEARTEIEFLRTMLREGLEEVRNFIAGLRPPAVDMGLAEAIATEGERFEANHGISVSTSLGGIDSGRPRAHTPPGPPSGRSRLNTGPTPAAATEVSIGLDGRTLVIGDNGRGFDVMRLASSGRNFGLQFMKERAELIGTHLQIESRQGEGTRILLRLPERDGKDSR